MNKLLLKLVMLPSALWRGIGVDVAQLSAILQVRLMLDDRKPVSFVRSQKQKKEHKYSTVVSSVMLLMMGVFYMFPLWTVHDRIYSLTIYFSILLAVIVFMLITDFSSVLFDARDKFILFHRPVNDRTLVLARMLHVFIYLFRIVMPLALPGWVLLGFLDGGKSPVLFFLPLLMLIVMALFVVNGVYLLVLRLARPEKFKDVINFFQVVTSVIFFATVYLLPRMFDEDRKVTYDITLHQWLKYTPTYWLAASWSWIGAPVALTGSGIYSIFGFIFPLFCAHALVRWLAPQFSRRIAGIDSVEGVSYVPVKTVKSASGSKFYQKLANLFNRTSDARAGFMFAWLQSARSRSFRMRVYPSFAFVPIYFVYLLTQKHNSFSGVFENLGESKKHLLLMYMSSFVMINAMSYLNISDQYKAAWIFYATPIQTPGRVMIGAFKAVWVKYFLPFFIAIAIFVLYIWGLPAISDVLLALINVTLSISCIALINFRHLPFSMMEQMKQRGSRVVRSLMVMLVPLTLGFAHYIAMHFWWLKLIFMLLAAIFLWLIWDSYANTSWEKVIRSEIE